ncbi:MAG: sigma 54-interacting transcriptional regulator [Polyangiales bacterium]
MSSGTQDPPPEDLGSEVRTAAAGGSPGPYPSVYKLVVTVGEQPGLALDVERQVLVGTSESVDLKLVDRMVSRRHLELSPVPDGLRVRDLGSRNGTWCNGVRIAEATIGVSSTIRVGQTQLTVEASGRDRTPVRQRGSLGRFVGRAESLQYLYTTLKLAAGTDSTILIEGESGVGKELLAEAIHQRSGRRAGPLVVVDCGSIPHNLVESELFGHEAGAFTGATQRRIGAFEQAHGGTLFLDELGELEPSLQPRLLRVLDARSVKRVGGSKRVPVDLRIIAATNRNLDREVEEGRFRLDLFHRLSVVAVRVPPLRERLGDVILLARLFLEHFNGAPELLSDEVKEHLISHGWPGNARELRNYMERLVVMRGEVAPPKRFLADVLRDKAVMSMPYREAKQVMVEAFNATYVASMLELHGSVTDAAKSAEIARRHFHRLKSGGDID